MSFFTILTAGIFTDNVLLHRLFNIEYAAEQCKSPIYLLKKCSVLTCLLMLSSAITYPLIKYVLIPTGTEYLAALLVVAAVIAILFAIILLLKRFLPNMAEQLKNESAVLCSSATVIGVCLGNIQSEIVTGYLSALVYTLCCGIGFTAVAFIFYGIRYRLEGVETPYLLKGLPLTLLTASLLSMAFAGLG